MTGAARQKESRSLRLYARLLELYPPAFLQRHRAEMLQNFADLEDAAASKAALWLLIGKDLTMNHAQPSDFASLRRLSARHAVHVHLDVSPRNAAKQFGRLS